MSAVRRVVGITLVCFLANSRQLQTIQYRVSQCFDPNVEPSVVIHRFT